jgi:hypothetical protein
MTSKRFLQNSRGRSYLQPGDYLAQIILTEESFHGNGGSYAGNWAGAMGAGIQFFITCHGDMDRDGDADGSDLVHLILGNETLDIFAFAVDFGRGNCPH